MSQSNVVPLDPLKPDPQIILRAAEIIKRGGLVAFPTETVYGLGATALDANAVARIFEAKGRPPTNPVIVHVASIEQAQCLVTEWPQSAEKLANAFWPGPLTLVLKKASIVPDIVTAGGPTVGIRMPANEIAQALIRAAGVPLAAPSANRSTELSATTAEHVRNALDERVELILDGGACQKGIESTVLDLTQTPLRLLRPGAVSLSQLKAVIGEFDIAYAHAKDKIARSPGQMDRHYAPRTPLVVRSDAMEYVKQLLSGQQQIGWLALPHDETVSSPFVTRRDMPNDAESYGQRLYSVLHELDRTGVNRIVVSLPPATEEWLAIHDRLRRASHPVD